MYSSSSSGADQAFARGEGGRGEARERDEEDVELFAGTDIYEGMEEVGAGMEQPHAGGMSGERGRDEEVEVGAPTMDEKEKVKDDEDVQHTPGAANGSSPFSRLENEGYLETRRGDARMEIEHERNGGDATIVPAHFHQAPASFSGGCLPLAVQRNAPPPPSRAYFAYHTGPLPSIHCGSVLIGTGGRIQQRIKHDSGLADLSILFPPAVPLASAVLLGSRGSIRRALQLMHDIVMSEQWERALPDEQTRRLQRTGWSIFAEEKLVQQEGWWLWEAYADPPEDTLAGPAGPSSQRAMDIPTAAAPDFLPTSGCVPFIEQLSGTKVVLSTSSSGTELTVTGPDKLALRQALNDIQRVVAQKVPGWTAPATEEEELASASAAFVSRSSKPSSTFSTPTSDGRRRSPARSLSVSSAEYDSAPPSRRRSRSRRSLSPYRKTNERYERAEDEYGRRNGLGRRGDERRSRRSERGRDERRDRHGGRGRTMRQDRNDEHYTRSTSPPLKRLGLYNRPPPPPGRDTFDRPPYPAPPRSYHRNPPRQAPRNPPADLDFAVGGGPVHLELGGTVRQDEQRGGRQGGRGWRRFGEDQFVEGRMDRVEQWRRRG
ncbi:hypothetical protein JCM10213_002678 [Rhodosporidiobolus nylandii]